MHKNKKVVIIGGGHAGCACAKALRHEQFNGEIVLISNESELPYHRPPLSKSFIKDAESMSYKELNTTIRKLTKQMHSAAAELDFEKAAMLRDKIMELKKMLHEIEED